MPTGVSGHNAFSISIATVRSEFGSQGTEWVGIGDRLCPGTEIGPYYPYDVQKAREGQLYDIEKGRDGSPIKSQLSASYASTSQHAPRNHPTNLLRRPRQR